MADELGILIKAKIAQSQDDVADINRQIENLAKKVKKLDLGIDINKDTFNAISSLAKSLEKINDITSDSTRVIKEEINEFRNLDGTVERVTKQYLKNGEIIERTKTIIKEQADLTDSASRSVGKLVSQWEKVGQKIQEVTKLGGNGEYLGGSSTFQDNFTKQILNYNENDRVTSAKIIEDIGKAERATEEYNTRIEKLKANITSLEQTFKKLGDTVSYLGDDFKQLNTSFQKTLAAPGDLESLKAAENQYKQLFDEIRRIQNLGTQKARLDPAIFNLPDEELNTGLNELIRTIYKEKGASEDLERTQISLSRSFDSAGKEIYRYNISIKDGTGVARQYAGAIDRMSASIYENAQKTRDATNRSLNFVSQMKTALLRVPVWMSAMTVFYGSLHTLQDIVSTIVEVDKKMTELKRVMSDTTDFNKFLKDNIDLSNELGQRLSDVLDLSAEFARQGFDQNQIIDLTRTAGLLQNISDLSTDQALDALTSAMKNFNIEASNSIQIADKLNEVDNKYSISTQQLATSLFKAASTAKTFGVSLDELIGDTTAIGEITRESGNVIGKKIAA